MTERQLHLIRILADPVHRFSTGLTEADVEAIAACLDDRAALLAACRRALACFAPAWESPSGHPARDALDSLLDAIARAEGPTP